MIEVWALEAKYDFEIQILCEDFPIAVERKVLLSLKFQFLTQLLFFLGENIRLD
jgi:hypothetical protein